MRPDEFEERLARTPLKLPPPAWREEILKAARTASRDAARRPVLTDSLSRFISESMLRWRQWVAPWGVLAAAWCLAFLLNHVDGLAPGVPATRVVDANTPTVPFTPTAPSTPPANTFGWMAAARAYQAQLLDLTDPDAGFGDDEERLPVSDPPTQTPRPRTQRAPVPGSREEPAPAQTASVMPTPLHCGSGENRTLRSSLTHAGSDSLV